MAATSGLLLVHGGGHGPWCWENFVEYLSRQGHDVRAVQLRGHHRPSGRIWYRVHHYVKDVERAAAGLTNTVTVAGNTQEEDAAGVSQVISISGGEGGIRTHGPLRDNGFRDRPIRPLSHLSASEI
jgi:Alpha/beta hydrolase family